MKTKHLPLFILFAALTLTPSDASAQFSIGADLGLPLGDFSTISNPGFGISGRYDDAIQNKLNWTASLGFLTFSGKDYSGGSYGSTFLVPFSGGVKYYFNETNKGFYGAGDAGFSFITYTINSPLVGTVSNTTLKFQFAPGIGYRMNQWDFSARFNLISGFNFFGIRAAYVLKSN